MSNNIATFLDWGVIEYKDAWDKQEDFFELRQLFT